MKENISNLFFGGSKIKTVIAVLLVVVIAVVLILSLKSCNNTDGGYSKQDLPDIQFNENNGFSSFDDNSVQINAVTGLVVKSNTTAQTLNITNPSSNKYVFVVDIYLSDGTKLYTSDYIYPSDIVASVEFNQKLQEGIYRNALMVYTCCTPDDQHTPLTRYEFPIEIRSLVE